MSEMKTVKDVFKAFALNESKVEAQKMDKEFIQNLEQEFNVVLPKNISPQRMAQLKAYATSGIDLKATVTRFATKSVKTELGL